MSHTAVYNEFIYNISEEKQLKALRDNLLANAAFPLPDALSAAKLLLEYIIFSREPDEKLKAILLSNAAGQGKIRRYLAHTAALLQNYLPIRRDFLECAASQPQAKDLALYQNYCAWKDNYLQLKRAGLVDQVASPLDIARELSEEISDGTTLPRLLGAIDSHEEASRAIDDFLARPLGKNAQQKAKKLTADFLSSLKALNELNYPLFYNSLAEFVTATHGKASRALALLLSAERLYTLEAKGINSAELINDHAELPSGSAFEAAPNRVKKKNSAAIAIPLIAGALLLILGGAGYLFFRPQEKAPAVATSPAAEPASGALTTPDAASDKAPVAAKPPASKTDSASENSRPALPLATIYAATSAGVKTCAGGPLTSANCPENRRGFLLKGDQVTILSENEAGWSKIEAADGKVWWIFSGFLQGGDEGRKWHPVTAAVKNAHVFEDKELKELSRFTLQEDGSYCARITENGRLQVASPDKVLGFIAKNKVKNITF